MYIPSMEKAAELAKEAWTDHLISEGRPQSDYQPEPFSVRFWTKPEVYQDHIADAIADRGNAWFSELFVELTNARTGLATAKTLTALGRPMQAAEQIKQRDEALHMIGLRIEAAVAGYVREMEEKDNA